MNDLNFEKLIGLFFYFSIPQQAEQGQRNEDWAMYQRGKESALGSVAGGASSLISDNSRAMLNFGHTIGHALEKFYGYETLRHGEAIAYGILASSFLSVKYSSLSKQDHNLIHKLIMKLPLPKLPQMDIEKVISLIRNDKKVKLGKINFILLSDIGKTEISNSVSIESIKEVLNLL